MNGLKLSALVTVLAVTAVGSPLRAEHPPLSVKLTRSTAEGAVVDFAAYPTPPYQANWTQWGKGLVASDGKVYSGVGDHKGIGGNSYLYEYDPNTGVLTLLADLQQAVPLSEGEYGFGKIHGRISQGADGKLYFASFYGVFGQEGQGSVQHFFRYDPASGKIEDIHGMKGYGFPSTEMWPRGMLFYAEGTDSNEGNAIFVAFDAASRKVVFRGPHPHDNSRALFVDKQGNAYFNGKNGNLTKYDRRANCLVELPVLMPSQKLRQTTDPGPDGFLYGFNRDVLELFRFDPRSGTIMTLHKLEGDAAGLALDPTGRYIYYIAIDSKGAGATPLYQLDLIDPARITQRKIADVMGHLADKYRMGFRSSYNMTVSKDGRELYVGFNGEAQVGFVVVHIPEDGKTAFVEQRETTPRATPSTSSLDSPSAQAVEPKDAEEPPGASQPSAVDGDTLASLENRYRQVAGRHEGDPEVKLFQDRLEALRDLAAQLMASLEVVKSSSMDELLNRLSGLPAAPGRRKTASELVTEFSTPLVKNSVRPTLPPEESAVMGQYYDAALRSAEATVASRAAEAFTLSGQDADEAIRLLLVLGFLHADDQAWSRSHTERLPAWVRTPKNLAVCEEFALECRRPATAYRLAEYRTALPGLTGGQLDYADYLQDRAAGKTLGGSFHDGVFLYDQAIAAAREGNKPHQAETLRLKLAEAHAAVGQNALAASEYQQLLEAFPDSADWGKAALARLICLYKAQAHDSVAKDVEKYRCDTRCKAVESQLTYIGWVAFRRLGKTDTAAALQKDFLQRFPDNPLGAEMQFASAMTALASGQYAKASEMLKAIETQYPDSELLSKVAEIQSRLKGAAKESDPPGSTNQ